MWKAPRGAFILPVDSDGPHPVKKNTARHEKLSGTMNAVDAVH